jgi:ribosomal protein S27AE
MKCPKCGTILRKIYDDYFHCHKCTSFMNKKEVNKKW